MNALPAIPADARARYATMFQQHSQGQPVITGTDAAFIFMESGLDKAQVRSICEKADLNRDGHFDLNEFCYAMSLIEQQISSPTASSAPMPTPPAYQGDTAPPPPNYNSGNIPPMVAPKELSYALSCHACRVGLVPSNTIYHCDECKDGTLAYCQPCHAAGHKCHHNAPLVFFQRAARLTVRDSGGTVGLWLKCNACRRKIRKRELAWHCPRCIIHDLCADCWKAPGNRCKHAESGKYKMCFVGDEGLTEIVDGVFGLFSYERKK